MALLLDGMRLVDAGTEEELVLFPSEGVIKVRDFSPGFAEVRRVQYLNPGWNGATDYTRLHGAKAVALALRIVPVAGQPGMVALSQLRSWLSPDRDVLLYYTPTGMAERVLYLSGDQLANDLAMDVLLFGVIDVQLQWSCPDGVEYSADTTQTIVKLQTPLTTGGRPYPLVYPRTYSAQVGTGVAVITNNGTAPTAPVVRIFGPVTGPVLTNETTGLVFAMAGYVIGDTEYLEVDMGAKTVQLRGVPGADANRRGRVTTKGWWNLQPGANTIRFTSETGAVPAQALVLSQDAWI